MTFRTLMVIAGTLAGGAVLAAPPDTQSLLEPCTACHGEAGVSVAAHIPHLNGQIVSYLVDDISAIASGRRKSAIADHIPGYWSGAEIIAVARFYESRQAVRPPQLTDAQKVMQGEAIYQQRCAECHPHSGRAAEFDSPLLAAQNLEYLINEIKLFVSGERKFVYKMDEAFQGLSMSELEAVAHFFASQPQTEDAAR